MVKRKKRYKRSENKLKLNVSPIYHSTINSYSTNPFYRQPNSLTFARSHYQGMHWSAPLRKDSAVNPFRRFGPDRLGIRSIKKKNMNWEQAKRKYPNMNPFGDADHDGVINMFDCKPFDRKRQDTNVGNAAKMKSPKPSKKMMQAISLQNKIRKLENSGGKSDLQKALSRYKRGEERLKEINAPIRKYDQSVSNAQEKKEAMKKDFSQRQTRYSSEIRNLDSGINKTKDQISSLEKEYKKARGSNKAEIFKSLLQRKDRLSDQEMERDKVTSKSEKVRVKYGQDLGEIKEMKIETPTKLEADIARIESAKLKRQQEGGLLTPGRKDLVNMEIMREKRRLGDSGRLVQAGQLSVDALKDIQFKKGLTKEYSPKMKATASQVQRATQGVFEAFTTTGGMFPDTPEQLVPFGPRFGLARVKQRMKQTQGAGKVGRPRGSYKYGAPVQSIMAAQREAKRQAAVQQLNAQQRAMQVSSQQVQQIQSRPMSNPVQIQQMQQMQQPEPQDMMNDNDTMNTFNGPMSTGFITEEMVNGPPQQYQPSQYPPQQMQQGPKDIYSRTVPATSLQRGNPFNLKAKYRPNLSFNPLKYLGKNLMTGGKPILSSVSPATTISTRNTTSTNQMLKPTVVRQVPVQDQEPRHPDFVFQNRDESGMLA